MYQDVNELLVDRYFQFWECRPSLSQLVIRSVKPELPDDFIDLIFVGVRFLQIPPVFNHAIIERASSEEIAYIRNMIPQVDKSRRLRSYAIIAQGVRYFIVATWFGVYHHHYDEDYHLPFNLQALTYQWFDQTGFDEVE